PGYLSLELRRCMETANRCGPPVSATAPGARNDSLFPYIGVIRVRDSPETRQSVDSRQQMLPRMQPASKESHRGLQLQGPKAAPPHLRICYIFGSIRCCNC